MLPTLLLSGFIFTLLTAAHPLLPQSDETTGSAPSTALTTNTTYYQGPAEVSEPLFCGAQVVSNATITQSYCYTLKTYSLAIQALEDAECSFTLFKGSASCDADATEVVHVGITRGEGAVCVTGGVEDGGRFERASGVWVCG